MKLYSFDSKDGEVEESLDRSLESNIFVVYIFADVEETFSNFGEVIRQLSSLMPRELIQYGSNSQRVQFVRSSVQLVELRNEIGNMQSFN